jgi:hypothetical protein
MEYESMGVYQAKPQEPLPDVDTPPTDKTHRDKEPLRAGKEEAIEHRSDLPTISEEEKKDQKEKEEQDEEQDEEEVEDDEEEKRRMRTEKFPQFIEKSPIRSDTTFSTSHQGGSGRIGARKSESGIPPPPPIEGLQARTRSASGSLYDSKPTIASMRPVVRKQTEAQASTITQEELPGSQSFQVAPSSNVSSYTQPPKTADSKRMDLKFELDVLRMRLQAAIKSRDEVLTRWATHEALRDRNLTLLEQIRRNVMTDLDELSNRSVARDYAMNVEHECRRKLDEAHSTLVRLEHERAECEARHLGERQICSELERRIQDHTTGIDHSMVLKQKRELEVQDLELKIRIIEL